MAETIAMPKWGLTMEERTIVEWMVGEGDTVEKGDILAVVETEKTSVELTSPFSGVVARVLVADGETVPVGTPLLILAGSPEEAAQLR
ncbi:biotin/lipoyl-containing protein [Thermogemmatispora carboxidivorans]|uniref:biotin/lipoyl-containing protein n=1 Tax=Thermogemmatispora carboxidivorans TaxID=1382306 RepID=UPI00069B10AA|nr:biotin/lipoyl-containing protein [Thermogemmatispora carboxidivorans]